MYDQMFRNQAVKECVNGQSLRSTARKYGISDTALRSWIAEYKKRMSELSGSDHKTEISSQEVEKSDEVDIVTKESIVKLMSINIDIDGYNVTMAKKDVIKLMAIFYQFDK